MNAPREEFETISVTPIAQPRAATQQSEKWLSVSHKMSLPAAPVGLPAHELFLTTIGI